MWSSLPDCPLFPLSFPSIRLLFLREGERQRQKEVSDCNMYDITRVEVILSINVTTSSKWLMGSRGGKGQQETMIVIVRSPSFWIMGSYKRVVIHLSSVTQYTPSVLLDIIATNFYFRAMHSFIKNPAKLATLWH